MNLFDTLLCRLDSSQVVIFILTSTYKIFPNYSNDFRQTNLTLKTKEISAVQISLVSGYIERFNKYLKFMLFQIL